MGKWIKLLLGGIILMGLFAVALVFGAMTYFDPNDYKDRIITKFETETGRKLILTGDISLSYYPWLGLEIKGMTMGNPAGFGNTPFISADVISLRIKTMPLLKKRYEFDTLKLHGVKINLVKNQQGMSNWGDFVHEEKNASEKQEPLTLTTVIFGGIDMKDAQFIWEDKSTEQTFQISDMNVSTGALIFGKPIDIKMNLKVASGKPAINADINMQGTALYDLDTGVYTFNPIEIMAALGEKNISDSKADFTFSTGVAFNLKKDTASINNLTFSGLGTRIKAQFNASHIQSGKPMVEAQLSVVGDDLARLFKAAEVEPLAEQLLQLRDRTFHLQTNVSVDMDKDRIAISDLNASLIGAVITGQLMASNMQSDTPVLAGKLNATGQDLPTLLQVLGQFETSNAPKLASYGKKLSKVSNKRFEIHTEFDADLTSGNINIPILSAKALGITVDGHLSTRDIKSHSDNINGKLSLQGDELSSLLVALGQDGLAESLSAFSMDVVVQGNSNKMKMQPWKIEALFTGKQIPNALVKATLNADAELSWDRQALIMKNMHFHGFGLDLKANVHATQIMDNPVFRGDMVVTEFNLRKFMRQMKQKLPTTADKKALTKIALQTKFSGSDNNLEFKKIALLLDDTNLQGKLTVKNFTQPQFDFDIVIDSINIDRYLPLSPTQATKSVKQAKATTDLPLEILKKINGKGRLRIDKLVYANLHLNNIALSIHAKDGFVGLEEITANLYQGKYNGMMTLDARNKSLEIKQEMQLSGVQIEPLLQNYTQSPSSQLAGVANITAKISSKGTDTLQLKNGLRGQIHLAVTEGILRGINVRKTLEQAEILLESKRLTTLKQGGETRFDQLTGTLSIQQGVVKNNDLLMTSLGFEVHGGVNAQDTLGNLRDHSIKYDLSVAVVKASATRGDENYNIGGYTIPIKCRGSLGDLAAACKPDYGKLLGKAIQKGVLDKLGKTIGIDLSGKKKLTREQATQNKKVKNPTTEETSQQKVTPKSEDPVEKLIKKKLKGVFDKLF